MQNRNVSNDNRIELISSNENSSKPFEFFNFFRWKSSPLESLLKLSVNNLEKPNDNKYQNPEIKYVVDINKLSPAVDFWVLGKNVLLYSYSPSFRFLEDINAILNEFYVIPIKEVPQPFLGVFPVRYGTHDPWTRDFIATKTPETVYVFNKVRYRTVPTPCDFLLMSQLLNEDIDKLPISTDVAYVRIHNQENNQLFHVNKTTRECTKIELTQDVLNQLDKKLNPKIDSRRLTGEELGYIALMTNHVPSEHSPKDEFSTEIIKNNSNISNYISKSFCDPRFLNSDKISETAIKPSQVLVQGGNLFHCVNAIGENYIIVGELGLVSQNKIYQEASTSEAGKKSNEKYLNINFREKEEIVKQRQLNKQILKKQVGDAKVVIVPNSFFFHIDLEMCVLPNGVVLVHSHEESIRLLKANKDRICKTKQFDYNTLYEKVLEHHEKTEHLFAKTTRKLKKRGFIVIPVCGFLTLTNDITGIVATGFNGLPVVIKNGKILYTLPKNPEWYNDYFTKVLETAGVSFIRPIKSMSLAYLAYSKGFFRCQINTIPNEMVKLSSLRTN